MITQEEYLKLKELYKHNFRWIAKDKSDSLYVFKVMPMKFISFWAVERCVSLPYLVGKPEDNSFTYIKWEDEKPTKILDLIQDYEKQEELKGGVVIHQFVADWIEECKKSKLFFTNLNLLEGKAEVKNWIYEHDNGDDTTMKREEMVIKAYYDGYVVEKEKLYTVRLANGSCLYKFELAGIDWTKAYSHCEKDMHCQLTQSEIESVDPRLMQFAVEVE